MEKELKKEAIKWNGFADGENWANHNPITNNAEGVREFEINVAANVLINSYKFTSREEVKIYIRSFIEGAKYADDLPF